MQGIIWYRDILFNSQSKADLSIMKILGALICLAVCAYAKPYDSYEHGVVLEGPSGVVTSHGASGPSGVVTARGASGPSGVVTSNGARGPSGVVTSHGAKGPSGYDDEGYHGNDRSTYGDGYYDGHRNNGRLGGDGSHGSKNGDYDEHRNNGRLGSAGGYRAINGNYGGHGNNGRLGGDGGHGGKIY